MVSGRVPVFPFPSFRSRGRKSGWVCAGFIHLFPAKGSPGAIPVAGSPGWRGVPFFLSTRSRVRFPVGASQFGRHCKAAGGEICSLPAVPGWFNQRSREWSRIWRNGLVIGAVTKEQINRGKMKSAIMKVVKVVFGIIRNARDAENGFKR